MTSYSPTQPLPTIGHWMLVGEAPSKMAINTHLRTTPAKTSKSRIKRLRDIDQPQYRLRVDEYRVFYDIVENDVLIVAIVPKADAEDWLNQFGILPEL